MTSSNTRVAILVLPLVLLAALPVAVVPVPQMADLPNHIARHHILATALFGDGSPYWTVSWRWIGNLGVDLPTVLLSPMLGVELATRLVVATIAPLTVLGLLALGRAGHGRMTPGVALALPFAFAQPWHYGFINSCLSVALALFAAAAWLRRPADDGRRAIGFAVAALGVWSAHVMGWGVLLLLVAGAELARLDSWRAIPARVIRAAPLLAPLVPMLAWRGAAEGPAYVYAADPLNEKAIDLATMLKGLWLPFDLLMLATVALLGMVALLVTTRPRIEPRLGMGAVLLVLAFSVMPTTVLGSWGADLRLAPVVAMISLVAIGPAGSGRIERLLIMAGIGLFIVRALVTTGIWLAAQPVLKERLAMIGSLPRGGRVGYVIATPACNTPWTLTVDNKLASLAVARRDVFTNPLFRIPGADLIMRRHPSDAEWFDGTQNIPCAEGTRHLQDRLAALSAARFDSIWIADPPAGLIVPSGYHVISQTARDAILIRAASD